MLQSRMVQQMQDDLSPEEWHAIGHARYQLKHATPEHPACCFDYEIVAALLQVIDRLRQKDAADER